MTQLTTHNTDVTTQTNAPTRLSDLSQLTKPRITVMVLLTTALGYAIGAGEIGMAFTAAPVTLVALLVGTAMSCMGSATLNQVIERDTDALMPRTADRPLPAGRMNLATAAIMGLSLALLGVAILLVMVNPLTAAVSAFTITSYALVYTPLKRVTHLATIVGAAPGAAPPVMGYAAATGDIGPAAVAMFAILFLWQLPHFLAIAWLYRADYGAASIPVLPVVDPSGVSTFRQMLLSCMAMLPLGLVPTMIGVSGVVYFVGALLCGLAFLASAIMLTVQPSRARARLVFFVSLIYLPIVFGLMLIDQL